MNPAEYLALARKHMSRVQSAWDPPDWSDLALYGFYCLENAVMAAAMHFRIETQRSHPAKAKTAKQLASDHALPDVSALLVQLNDARKAEAYGDVDRPELGAEDVARQIEEFVKAVEALLG